jgi:hypothetical protein
MNHDDCRISIFCQKLSPDPFLPETVRSVVKAGSANMQIFLMGCSVAKDNSGQDYMREWAKAFPGVTFYASSTDLIIHQSKKAGSMNFVAAPESSASPTSWFYFKSGGSAVSIFNAPNPTYIGGPYQLVGTRGSTSGYTNHSR